jgi:hypothetical protein
VSLLNYLAADFAAISAELPVACSFNGQPFTANRSTFRRDNQLQDGGFFGSAAMVLTAPYNSVTQAISLGDRVLVAGAPFRVMSAELAQDAVSVDFQLEDINK